MGPQVLVHDVSIYQGNPFLVPIFDPQPHGLAHCGGRGGDPGELRVRRGQPQLRLGGGGGAEKFVRAAGPQPRPGPQGLELALRCRFCSSFLLLLLFLIYFLP